ncbi:MAG: hypothetical protein UH080_04235 [Ruminococcus sp.]|nr:hypothetical protein [Ruminococcus sp.]
MEYNQQRPQYPRQPYGDNRNGYYQNPQQRPNNRYQQPPQQQPDYGYQQNPQQQPTNGYHQAPPQQPNTYNRPQTQNAPTTESKKTEEKAKTPLTKKDSVIATCALLWIAVTIIAAILLVSITGNIGWGILSLGQFVFFSGIILRISDNNKRGPSIYLGWILTGFITLVTGIMFVVKKPAFLNKLWDIVPYLIIAVFFGLTLLGLYGHTSGEKRKKERCKIPVQAEIIDHLRGTSYYTQGVFPLFRYTYNGVVYEESDNMHASKEKVPPKGSYITLYINENNPKEFHADWNGRNNTLCIETGRYVGLLVFWAVAFFSLPFILK